MWLEGERKGKERRAKKKDRLRPSFFLRRQVEPTVFHSTDCFLYKDADSASVSSSLTRFFHAYTKLISFRGGREKKEEGRGRRTSAQPSTRQLSSRSRPLSPSPSRFAKVLRRERCEVSEERTKISNHA